MLPCFMRSLLRSYFSKEHQKVIKNKSSIGSDEVYHSPWFAYNHLLFTADSGTLRENIETCTEEVKDSQAETFNGESSVTSITCMSEDEHEFTLPPIRKKRVKSTKHDDKEEEYSFMKKATEELTQKDEFTIYGQLIAHKIRNLNSYNRLIAQHRINNILFDLEMGQINGEGRHNDLMTPNISEMRNLTDMPNVAENVTKIPR